MSNGEGVILQSMSFREETRNAAQEKEREAAGKGLRILTLQRFRSP